MGDSKVVEKFTIFASKLGHEIHLRSLRDAFATIMPLYILAGLAVLINNTVFQWVLSGDTLTGAQYWGTLIVNGTLNISSLLIAPVIGYMLSQNKGYENPLAAAVVSMATLVVMMPNTISITPMGAEEAVMAQGVLSFCNIGTGAMFAGVIIGLAATEIFIWVTTIRKLQINLGDSIPPAVGKSFNVLVPFILVMSGFALISAVLNNLFHTDLVHIITTLIQEPLLIVNMTQNMAAFAAGEAIPNIINVAFVPAFGMMGGSGSTICLLIATFLVSKNMATKSVSKMAFVPGLFNINEPVIFGYSIVYNVCMLIPFVLVPALGLIIGYAATAMHLMNECVVYIPWTTPLLLSGYLATGGDWRAILVQLVILSLGILIYIPFVKMNDIVMERTMAEE